MSERAPLTGRQRVVIERVTPTVDDGRFPIKRIVGDTVVVEADVFGDGHDRVACRLLHRVATDETWQEAPMTPLGNDRWRAQFTVTRLGEHIFAIDAWVDRFTTWRADLAKRVAAGQDVSVDVLTGAALAEEAAEGAPARDGDRLRQFAASVRTTRNAAALDDELAALIVRHLEGRFVTRSDREYRISVDRERARFSTWYEVFPRSTAREPGHHGTFADCERWLPYIASQGFDVLYLPPIHPIGRTHRKGRNNAVAAEPDDVGSPWAIGGSEGGHKAVHPALGTLEDFDQLVAKAAECGLEIALDIAFQCTPDHPYVTEHPEWFRTRPDGTIQYAENPPKKYQDIYPIDFESEDWEALWAELASVFRFWIGHGVKIFRVDNPHTKAFPFWEWVIAEITRDHPDAIFLSEAFTRPKVMYRLAKLGFDQSYTYFTWRTSKAQLVEYFEGLISTPVREFFRPNLWPSTPDILPEHLQLGGRPAFAARLALAATLGANYGIYGPAYELGEHAPREEGSEEYLDSEKYEIRQRDLNAPSSLRALITRINRIRRENPALQADHSLRFHLTDNPLLLCYSKATSDVSNVLVMVVNLDPVHRQSGWVTLDLDAFGIAAGQTFQAHDLLTDSRFLWHGPTTFVDLAPESAPAHILRLRIHARTEEGFDYYL